ncbi:hypothetical protein EDD86DRAFT_232516 [Gorgonomyces haynaldii]|nr:hypothetical protein EDD86DRAFT_232516 [Gorgonomyces haynaldii]
MEGGVLEWTKRGYPVITNTPVPFVHLFYEPTTSTCCYIVVDEETKTCAIIDPVLDYNLSSGEVTTVFADKLLDFVQTNDLVVSHILETHIHADHVTAAAYLKHMLKNHPPVCIGRGVLKVQENMIKILDLPKEDIHPGHFDILWQDKQTFSVGSIPAQVIPTPGHTPDSVTYVIGDSLFCGDSVFYPDVGSARCDFPDGSAELLFKGVKSLYEYPDTFKLFSGHDYPPNRSTAFFAILGQEKKQNKQLNQTTVEQEFVQWRKHRDATLGAPRLLYPSLCFNLKGGRMPRDGFVKTPVKWALNLIQ